MALYFNFNLLREGKKNADGTENYFNIVSF